MLGILVWWLLITLMGVAVLPITIKTFQFLPDRGYAFSKPLGLLIIGLLCWLIGFVSFSSLTIFLAFALLAGLSYWLWVKYRAEMRTFLKEKLGYLLAVELFFAVLFLLFMFFRMYNPDILGTEKFMDMAFLNSMSRGTSFPPYDPWMAGPDLFISYYYLGYLLMSILVRASGIAPAIGFNLSLGLLFALAGVSTFGLIYNLTRRLSLAFGGWSFIYLLGNLDGFRQVLLTKSIGNFNWWTPSRVIPDTINEFPFFSFLLGDMHPHMLSIPFVMLALGLALNHLKSPDRDLSWRAPDQLGRYILWGLVIGALGFMNSWDLPTAFFIAGLAFFFQQYRQRPRLSALPWKEIGLGLGIMLVLMIVPFLPFYLHFQSQAKGIAWTTQNTRVTDFLLVFGTFVFLGLTFVVTRYHRWFLLVLAGPAKTVALAGKHQPGRFCPQCGAELREGKRICGHCGYQITALSVPEDASVPLARPASEMPKWITSLFLFLLQPITAWRQGQGRMPALIVSGVLLVVAGAMILKGMAFGSAENPFPYLLGFLLLVIFTLGVLLLTRVDQPETIFILMLLFTAGGLLFGCEVLHINDTFSPPLDRMNTVFKFYYQAWFLLGIGGVAGVAWSFRHSFRNRNVRVAWLVPLVLLVAASLVYPYASVRIKTNRFTNVATLDGSYYLKNTYPADREGIEWLRQNVRGNPVVLEATGGEYTDFARVSTFTGLPTVLGWGGHELQWRGNYDEPGQRVPDIDTLYGSPDPEAAKALLAKYDITFVFVGTLERQKYSATALNKFAQFMDVAYEHPGGVRIYRRR